jgi:hypothetical protein
MFEVACYSYVQGARPACHNIDIVLLRFHASPLTDERSRQPTSRSLGRRPASG